MPKTIEGYYKDRAELLFTKLNEIEAEGEQAGSLLNEAPEERRQIFTQLPRLIEYCFSEKLYMKRAEEFSLSYSLCEQEACELARKLGYFEQKVMEMVVPSVDYLSQLPKADQVWTLLGLTWPTFLNVEQNFYMPSMFGEVKTKKFEKELAKVRGRLKGIAGYIDLAYENIIFNMDVLRSLGFFRLFCCCYVQENELERMIRSVKSKHLQFVAKNYGNLLKEFDRLVNDLRPNIASVESKRVVLARMKKRGEEVQPLIAESQRRKNKTRQGVESIALNSFLEIECEELDPGSSLPVRTSYGATTL